MNRRAPLLAFFAMGLFTLAAQSALFRESLVAHSGNELAAGIFFSSWLVWVGAGAALSLRLLRLRPGFRRRLPGLLAAWPVALAVELVLFRFLRPLAGVEPGDIFPTGRLFAATFFAALPVSFVTGLLFPLASAVARDAAKDAGAAVGRVYTLECLGSFVGGAGFTLLLDAGAPGVAALPPAGAIVALSAALLARERRLTMLAASTVFGLFVLLSIPPVGGALARELDRLQWSSLHPATELVARVETPYRRLSVARVGEQTVFAENGRIVGSFPGGDAAIPDAALLSAQPARVRRVLLVGGGLVPLADALSRYGPEEITRLEPDPVGARFLDSHLPAELAAGLSGPGRRTVFGDPRSVVPGMAQDARRFDLVVVEAGDPDTALTARLFTAEFYGEVRSVLAEGGVLAVAVRSGENYLGSELARYGASVLATLRSRFAEVAVAPGERSWFLAGATGRPTADAPEVERRLRARAVRDPRFAPARIEEVLPPGRVEEAVARYEEAIAEAGADLVSTDARPVVYLLNLLVVGREEGTGLAEVFGAVRRGGILLLLLPIAAWLLLRFRYALGRPESVRSGRFAAGALLALVGFASISLALVLLLGFQSRFGLLFREVGLASALFMLGLAVGSVAGTRVGRAGGRSAVAAGIALLLVSGFAFALSLATSAAAAPAAWLALFAVAGALCGAPFPLAAALLSRAGASAAGAGAVLESADHLGGAVGAALAGVVLVPLFGVGAACRFLGIVVLAGPVLLLLEAAVLRAGSRVKAVRRMRSRTTTFPFVRTGFVLAAITSAAALLAAPIRRELDRPKVRLPADRLRAAAPAERYREVDEPFLHYDAWNAGESDPTARVVASAAVAPDVTGFAGPLNLLVALDRDGTIRRVSLLDSKETPTYVRELPELLARFEGCDAARDFRLVDRSADPPDPYAIARITGATVSSRAAVETVNRTKNRLLADLLGRAPPSTHAPAAALGPLDRTVWTSLALFFLAIPVFLSGRDRLRTVFLAIVFVLLGVWLNVQLSAERVVEVLGLSLPPPGNPALLLLVGGALLLAVLFGPVYCGYLCPFGAAQELVGKLGLLRRPGRELDRRARFTKHVVLAATATAALLGSTAILAFDPLAVVFSGKAGALLWALVGLVLVASAFWFRFWCRYLCPVGAFLSLFNRVALLRRLAPKRDPGRCDLGVTSKIDLDCLTCNRCLARATRGDG